VNLGVRLTVIAPDGRVVGESTRSSESLENHADRPEIRAALAEGSGQSVRLSATVQSRLLYVAWRQARGGDTRVVRVALPLQAVEENVAHLRRLLQGGIVVAAVFGLVMALLLSRGMLRRIQRLVAFARDLAAGEPAPYIAPERRDNLGLLEAQLGEMARNVAATIGELRVERERLEAILRGMVEGVLVTDLEGRVVLMNARARELLGTPGDLDGRGRLLVELVRDPALAEIVRDLASGAPVVSREVLLGADRGLALGVNAARLRSADGRAFGYVLVLHDITELRRLEVIRRDFVANVSHELRTPLTAIKGYAETLLGPAGDDRDTARRFLAVIDRHSERHGRLIDDLLTLSDLELGRTPLRLAAVSVGVAVDDVLQILADRMEQLHLSAEVAPDTPPVWADGDRLRQVLINLIDNAVKYTPAGGQVTVRAAVTPEGAYAGMVEIAVQDTGMGIPAADLPRLTERFFRVDKARSRELGGTGLGLAIVKHIVQAHGGRLAIASTLGHGTTIRAFFPAATPEAARRTAVGGEPS
jgi:two-component system phosphate regulon sensor histidine kinase PhoR